MQTRLEIGLDDLAEAELDRKFPLIHVEDGHEYADDGQREDEEPNA